jgi:hypothetical protein
MYTLLHTHDMYPAVIEMGRTKETTMKKIKQ